MENKEILSASNPMPVLGAFAGELNRAGTFDSGKEFLKGLFKGEKKETDASIISNFLVLQFFASIRSLEIFHASYIYLSCFLVTISISIKVCF